MAIQMTKFHNQKTTGNVRENLEQKKRTHILITKVLKLRGTNILAV